MIYPVAAIAELARECAPEVSTEAIVPLIITESGGDPLAINVNRGPRVRARSAVEAATIVRRYIAAGYTIDVGLAQINSANFAYLGVTVEQVFQPCTNLRLASVVLQRSYAIASRHYNGLDAISATYSLYNTGTLTRGLLNGYVGRVWAAANALGSVPALPALPSAGATGRGSSATTLTNPDRWDVSVVASNNVMVFQ